jgi:hypothetical protein
MEWSTYVPLAIGLTILRGSETLGNLYFCLLLRITVKIKLTVIRVLVIV